MTHALQLEAHRLWQKIKPFVWAHTYRGEDRTNMLFYADEVHDLKERCWYTHGKPSVTEDDMRRLNLLSAYVDLHMNIQQIRGLQASLLEQEFAMRPVCVECQKRVGRHGTYYAQDGRMHGEVGTFSCSKCRPNAARND